MRWKVELRIKLVLEPWEHVMYMGIGAACGSYIYNAHQQNKQDVKEILEYMGRRRNERR